MTFPDGRERGTKFDGMKVPFMDLKVQYDSIREEIDAAMARVMDTSAYIGGEALERFEANFSKFVGSRHCVGVGNGTDALFLALKALGLAPGDEAITVANTFFATSEAIAATGAKAIFTDCRRDYYTIDADLIEEKITDRTKAIVPVHLFGQPADMDPIMALAEKYGLHVVEDCAQAHGALYKGRRVGTFGAASCFSFYPGKNLGAYGDAGAILTDRDDLAKQCRKLANHGRTEKYAHEFEAYNSRLDGLQAAVLDVKLRHLPEWTAMRVANAKRYTEKLSGLSGIRTPSELPGTKCVYHLYVVRVRQRERFMKFLKGKGVSLGIHYPVGLPFLEAYRDRGHTQDDFPLTYQYQDEMVSLPMFPEMTEAMIDHVTGAIVEYFEISAQP